MASREFQSIRYFFVALIAAACAVVLVPLVLATPERSKQWAVGCALATHDFSPAQKLASELVRGDADDALNQLLLAEACSGLQLTDEALKAYHEARPTDPDLQVVKLYGLGNRLFADGRMRDAEPFLREALQRDPEHLEAAGKLAFLLRIQGRIWESMAPVQTLIRGDLFRGDEIHMLGSQMLVIADEDYLRRAAARVPDDSLPVMGAAKLHIFNNELVEAERLVNELLQSADDVIEVQAMKGWLLNESTQDEAFLAWNAQLPAGADEHPEIWFVRGQFLMRQQRNAEAARCFIEAVRRSPNHFEATYRLSQVLTGLGQTQAASRAGLRSQELAKVEIAINELSRGKTFEFMEKAVAQLAKVQRYWEAAALCEMVARVVPDQRDWARTKLRELWPLLELDHSFDENWISIEGLDPEEFPLPDWLQEVDGRRRPGVGGSTHASVAFVENAAEVGIDFTYFSGSSAARGLGHIFETTGGGVAVVDLDADRWPDLWLAQGSDIWAENRGGGPWLDRIYRNLDGERFEDVTDLCGVLEPDFSQGVAVGDFNSDGFPDVYVGNVGPNRLFQNNGDGTFFDVTDETGTGGSEWTLSPAIVDLNQDGHPEIYCVNYLNTEEVLARRCTRNGAPLTCAPTLFHAEQDRVFLNSGTMSFQDMTESSGIVCPDGKGLSLVAADVDGSGRISLFVGNDSTNNFFFRNQSERGGAIRFSEEAMLTGLACDGRGRAQATMGIATDDMNGDGRPDFFITNFFADPNTLYLSDSSGIYSDSTRERNLYDASYNLLGFGSQCLDADLDGRPDLIITNGHVDRSEATGEPDWMRPQFFRNTDAGFVELLSDSIGEFFAQKFLGRSLTRLDWNRDGKSDCCISNLYHPVSLVTNSTSSPGHVLVVRLVGVTVDRDAIGTSVTVEAGGQSWTRQLVAGDGYESSNERQMVFGLGAVDVIDRVVVAWTSGNRSEFAHVPVNVEATIVESRPDLPMSSLEIEVQPGH